jgi:hypothetical protein
VNDEFPVPRPTKPLDPIVRLPPPRALALTNFKTPLLTVVVPMYVLLPESVVMPVLLIVKLRALPVL